LIDPIKIKDKYIGKDCPTFLIAEMACAHQGDVSQALKLVHVAKNSKADAIQLQIFKKEIYISPRHKDYDIVSKIELSQNEWQKIIDEIRKLDMILFGTGYDIESVKLLIRNDVDAFKIHSSDVSNIELIREIGKSKKPVFLSCGASHISEIQKAITLLCLYGTKNIILMHGFQAYPTKIEDSHLSYIKTLEKTFNLNVGFYDHVDADSIQSTIIPIMSIGYGAQVIEKHFTLNRKEKGVDYESSLNPKEFIKFQRTLRESEKAIGFPIFYRFSDDELKYRKNVKKSLVYVRDMKNGTIIKKDDIIAIRSYYLQIQPECKNEIIGRTLTENVKKNNNVQWKDFE